MEANEPTLAAGTLHFNVYNTDQDPHTFAIANADGQQVTSAVNIPAGQPSTPVTVTVNLPPGTYTLYCTLPMHAAEGMLTTIVVK
jgi:plastocyanin